MKCSCIACKSTSLNALQRDDYSNIKRDCFSLMMKIHKFFTLKAVSQYSYIENLV